jgi:hypothetical protein
VDFSKNKEKIEGPLPPEECYICGKKIHDDEWVDNWGSCDECFNRMWDSYVQEHQGQRNVRKL